MAHAWRLYLSDGDLGALWRVLGCGGPWHSQTNEAWFTHAPGLKVAMPSTPAEAAEMIASAAHGDDPTLILLPKYLFFKKCKLTDPVPLHIDQSRVRRSGKDMSLLAWGNTVDLALEAAEDAQNAGIDVEVIDIRFLAPFDPSVALASVAKTGRLLVVQEDNRTSSFGQSLICEMVSKPEIWQASKRRRSCWRGRMCMLVTIPRWNKPCCRRGPILLPAFTNS